MREREFQPSGELGGERSAGRVRILAEHAEYARGGRLQARRYIVHVLFEELVSELAVHQELTYPPVRAAHALEECQAVHHIGRCTIVPPVDY